MRQVSQKKKKSCSQNVEDGIRVHGVFKMGCSALAHSAAGQPVSVQPSHSYEIQEVVWSFVFWCLERQKLTVHKKTSKVKSVTLEKVEKIEKTCLMSASLIRTGSSSTHPKTQKYCNSSNVIDFLSKSQLSKGFPFAKKKKDTPFVTEPLKGHHENKKLK